MKSSPGLYLTFLSFTATTTASRYIRPSKGNEVSLFSAQKYPIRCANRSTSAEILRLFSFHAGSHDPGCVVPGSGFLYSLLKDRLAICFPVGLFPEHPAMSANIFAQNLEECRIFDRHKLHDQGFSGLWSQEQGQNWRSREIMRENEADHCPARGKTEEVE